MLRRLVSRSGFNQGNAMHYRSLLCVVGLAVVCACSNSPTAAAQSPTPTTGTPIGPAGGSVTSADGRARLDIPASALPSTVSFTVKSATAPPLDPATVTLSAYEITPAGTTFQVPARLHITYLQNLRPSGSAESELRVHRLTTEAWTLDTSSPENDPSAHVAAATITTTGTYSVRRPDPSSACTLPEDRQFDFWLGEWTFAQTAPVTSGGTNSITRDPFGCIILENFNNGRGRSISFYSRVDHQWHQTYVDTTGQRVTMSGEFEGTRMTLYTRPSTRWTWQTLNATEIRYFAEGMSGADWNVTFDSKYIAR